MVEVENVGDWKGKDLIDRDEEKIGKIEDVYIDTETEQPVFAAVKEGLVSKHLTFVPLVEASASPDGLRVPVSKKQVKDAPNLDQGAELSQNDEADLYRHYELTYSPGSSPSGRRLAKR